MIAFTKFSTKMGPAVACARGGAVHSLSFFGTDEQSAAWCSEQLPSRSGDPHTDPFPELLRQLELYFAGELRSFDLPLEPEGTPFQRQVWSALQQIPYGSTISYGELAAAVGRPGAARAVGQANRRNPIGVVIPCHRVLGTGGSLTGYAAGKQMKQLLLEHEGAIRSEPRLF